MRIALFTLLALALSSCSSIPTEHGRAWFVGDVAYATADPSGSCSIGSENSDETHDFGKAATDIGKHETHARSRTVSGGGACYAGSGITENLKAALAGAFAFLAGLML